MQKYPQAIIDFSQFGGKVLSNNFNCTEQIDEVIPHNKNANQSVITNDWSINNMNDFLKYFGMFGTARNIPKFYVSCNELSADHYSFACQNLKLLSIFDLDNVIESIDSFNKKARIFIKTSKLPEFGSEIKNIMCHEINLRSSMIDFIHKHYSKKNIIIGNRIQIINEIQSINKLKNSMSFDEFYQYVNYNNNMYPLLKNKDFLENIYNLPFQKSVIYVALSKCSDIFSEGADNIIEKINVWCEDVTNLLDFINTHTQSKL